MSLFRRKSDGRTTGVDPDDVAVFWSWWQSVRSHVADAIANGTITAWTVEISSHVDAMHPDLAWELSPGSSSEHVLVISAEGQAELRATAERVVRAAPARDSAWAYASSRQPTPDAGAAVLRLGDVTLELGRTRFVTAYDDERAEVDVGVYNPAFRELDDGVKQAVFLILDSVLGEDAVERWIGAIDVLLDEPAASVPIEDLCAQITKIEAAVEPFWVLLGDEDKGVVVLARRPLKRAEFPLFDLRVDITTTLASPESLEVAHAIDEQLEASLGTRGAHLASVTEDGRRTSHYYCDAETVDIDEIESAVHVLARNEQVSVRATPDPGWDAIGSYR